MLENNLDPDVAEKPEQLIVYGGTGKAARNWECFDAIVATLERLRSDETLLVQSGKPVGVFRTQEDAPRVLIANAMLVPAWATADEFRRLEGLGLTMYGQMTAGSWIYIGSQGIVQGTFETFAAAAAKHFGGHLEGRLVVTAGLGGMGGAQPLAATMNGAAALIAEVDPERIERRLRTRYLDVREDALEKAIDRALEAKSRRQAVSIGVRANAVDLLERLIARGVVPDLVTDQTSAHDELDGYVPRAAPGEDVIALRRRDPQRYIARAYETMAAHVRALAGASAARRRRVRLRKQPARPGEEGRRPERLRHRRLRASLHSPALLRGEGAVPLGRSLRRPRGHPDNGPGVDGPVSGQRAARAVAEACRRARRVSGSARAHLLARLR